MKAIICNEWCKPEDLKILEVENPTLNSDTVRIEVLAAGVNFPDVLIIQGKYQYKPNFPFSPGSEVAGKVIEIGENVNHIKVGDRVMSVTGHGAFAEQICIEANKVTVIPENLDFITAAGMSLTYGTSSYALFQRASIKENDFVLIHGATGGVGLSALEISKAMGAKVIATASTDEKLKIAKEYGADYCINYSKNEFKDKVKEIMLKLADENLDYAITYQSRVGPMKWIGPSTDEEIVKYSKEKKGLVVVPVAFVSEHSETLVELDIEYKKLAEKNGCSFYKRVPALGVEENFIKALTKLILKPEERGNFVSSLTCPNKFTKCPCK